MTYSSAVREFFNMSVIHPFSSHEGLSQSSFRALPIDTPPTILQKDTQFPSYFRHRANTNSTLLLPRGRYATVFELRSRMSSYAEKRRKLAEEEAKAKEKVFTEFFQNVKALLRGQSADAEERWDAKEVAMNAALMKCREEVHVGVWCGLERRSACATTSTRRAP